MPLSDVTCDNGESVTLRCKVCGRPRATVTWKGPNQSNLTNNGHFSIAYRQGSAALLHDTLLYSCRNDKSAVN